jgi:hypothetical protein
MSAQDHQEDLPPLDPELAQLLTSACADEPTLANLEQLRKNLASRLPPGTLGPSSGPASGPAQTASGAQAAPTSAWLWKIMLGLVVLGAGSAWLSLGAAASDPTSARASSAVGSSVAPSVASTATQPAVTQPAALERDPPPLAPTLPLATARPFSAKPEVSVVAATSSDGAPHESESAILSRAHQLLVAGQPQAALALANEHALSYPRGILVQERDMIRIESLAKLGRKQEAEVQATAFRKRFPGSSHLSRLEGLVPEAKAP